MTLPELNDTQKTQILEAIYKSTESSIAPSLLLESFIIGVLFACAPLGAYLLWTKPYPLRAPLILILLFFLTAMTTHWVLSLREWQAILSARFMGVTPTDIGPHDILYSAAWSNFPPLVTETVLFGFASILFAITAHTCFWPTRARRWSGSSLFIPAMASFMYTLSLVHWAISIEWFYTVVKYWADSTNFVSPRVAIEAPIISLVTLVSLNAFMSDSIVLWRMCIVWDRARPVIALGTVLLVATLALNLANIVANARQPFAKKIVGSNHSGENNLIYDGSYVGIAAAFVSLASNLCATVLVGIKACLHRSRFSWSLRSGDRRSFVQRVTELLADSGVAYTAIWLLYCISFFTPITRQALLGVVTKAGNSFVTATSHLDAAMAQLTSIYPLMVFILVKLEKIHYTRGLHFLRGDEDPVLAQNYAVTATFDIDVERSTTQTLGPSHTTITLQRVEDDASSAGKMKIRELKES